MPGVVSLPHGWGHDAPGTRLSVAARRPGVNVNRLTDDGVVDEVSGNAVLNGVPVRVHRGLTGTGRARVRAGPGPRPPAPAPGRPGRATPPPSGRAPRRRPRSSQPHAAVHRSAGTGSPRRTTSSSRARPCRNEPSKRLWRRRRRRPTRRPDPGRAGRRRPTRSPADDRAPLAAGRPLACTRWRRGRASAWFQDHPSPAGTAASASRLGLPWPSAGGRPVGPACGPTLVSTTATSALEGEGQDRPGRVGRRSPGSASRASRSSGRRPPCSLDHRHRAPGGGSPPAGCSRAPPTR